MNRNYTCWNPKCNDFTPDFALCTSCRVAGAGGAALAFVVSFLVAYFTK